jgi:ABC-2 type transport system permease protein
MSTATAAPARSTSTPPEQLRAAARALVNRRYIKIELRRVARNRRSMIFGLIMPVAFLLIFGASSDYRTQMISVHINVTAWITVSMALYGAMVAAVSGGASVSVERSQGWTRHLRLTPLRPASYILTKLVGALALGAVSVAVTLLVGGVIHAQMPVHAWIGGALLAWLGSTVFAAFGLFMGYLLPTENIMQILGPLTALLSFAGGLFVPLTEGSVFYQIAQFTPVFGVAELVRWPLGADFSWTALVNVIAWGAIFAAGAAWRFRRDTARV